MATYNLISKKIYVGVDVDDTMFTIAAIKPDGELINMKCSPNTKSLIKKLNSISSNKNHIKICYESTYLGFSLSRKLQNAGFDCVVIAASLIPSLASKKIKTDRVDSENLALYFKQGLLTEVYQPTQKDETVKQIIRYRKFLVEQLKASKNKLRSECRLFGFQLPISRNWSENHCQKITKIIEENVASDFREIFYEQIEYILKQCNQIQSIEKKINLYSEDHDYKKQHDALICLRGIKTISAMALIVELGDITRFKHPNQIASYLGLSIREYSSGGKENKFGISKQGNKRLRTTLVEANQVLPKRPYATESISRRRKNQPTEIINIAKKWDKRVYQKSQTLIQKNKNKNKVKVACAREQIGFVWEILNTISKAG